MSEVQARQPTILRRKQVEKRIGLSTSVIYQRMAANEFPKPIRLGKQAVGWIEAEIDAYIEGLIAASRDCPPKKLAPRK